MDVPGYGYLIRLTESDADAFYDVNFYYEPATDTLFFYGGFHDYYIGMMRVQNFSQSQLFHPQQAHARPDKQPTENLRSTQNAKVAL